MGWRQSAVIQVTGASEMVSFHSGTKKYRKMSRRGLTGAITPV